MWDSISLNKVSKFGVPLNFFCSISYSRIFIQYEPLPELQNPKQALLWAT